MADDCLRNVYVRGKYRDIILPMTVIRRFDVILEDKKEYLLSLKEQFEKQGVDDIENTIAVAFELPFFNIYKYTLRELKNETNMQNLKIKFRDYLDGFSSNVKDILKNFEFSNQIDKMADSHILDAVIDKFVSSEISLSPYPVKNNNGDIIKLGLDNHSMGTLFEELIRKFNEENKEGELEVQGIGVETKREIEIDTLDNIVNSFNDVFGNIEWQNKDNVVRQIKELPNILFRKETLKNAFLNSDDENIKIEYSNVLKDVMREIMKDNMELFLQFTTNNLFNKWLSSKVFNELEKKYIFKKNIIQNGQ